MGREWRRANFFGEVSKILMGWVGEDVRRWWELFEAHRELIGEV